MLQFSDQEPTTPDQEDRTSDRQFAIAMVALGVFGSIAWAAWYFLPKNEFLMVIRALPLVVAIGMYFFLKWAKKNDPSLYNIYQKAHEHRTGNHLSREKQLLRKLIIGLTLVLNVAMFFVGGLFGLEAWVVFVLIISIIGLGIIALLWIEDDSKDSPRDLE